MNSDLNINEKKLNFDAFIEEYKTLNLKEKQGLVIKDFKELIATLQQLCKLYRIDYDLLINREIVDVNKENYSEDDFSEAIYVYMQMFKEIMVEFLMPMITTEEDEI